MWFHFVIGTDIAIHIANQKNFESNKSPERILKKYETKLRNRS